jgi:hypothetical protein
MEIWDNQQSAVQTGGEATPADTHNQKFTAVSIFTTESGEESREKGFQERDYALQSA